MTERRAVRELVDAYGTDSLSFFALRKDKSYYFSPSRRAFLAYRVVAGAALISGDPVGEESEFDSLLRDFQSFAHVRGWRLAVVGALRRQSRSLRAARYARDRDRRRSGPDPERVLVGRPRDPQGAAIGLAPQKAGYRFRVVDAESIDDDPRTQLDAVSDAWRGNRPSADSRWRWTICIRRARRSRWRNRPPARSAASCISRLAAGGGWSLSTMRRLPGTPNGLTEFLVVETLAWAKENGVNELSLNFCALTDFVAPDRAVTVTRRAVRRVLLAADGVFQLERLHSFSRKFHPNWRPRYLCVEKLTDLPLVGLAYLHVEQLLVPPVRWTRRERVPH